MNSPEIQLALDHHREMNDSGHYWASLWMEQFPSSRIVKLTYGIKWYDGKKEQPLINRFYYLVDGVGKFIEHSLP